MPMFHLQFARKHPCAWESLALPVKTAKESLLHIGVLLVPLTLTDGSNSILKCQDWRDCVRLSNFGICGFPLLSSDNPLLPLVVAEPISPSTISSTPSLIQFVNDVLIQRSIISSIQEASTFSPMDPTVCLFALAHCPPTPQYLSSQLPYLPQKFPFPLHHALPSI